MTRPWIAVLFASLACVPEDEGSVARPQPSTPPASASSPGPGGSTRPAGAPEAEEAARDLVLDAEARAAEDPAAAVAMLEKAIASRPPEEAAPLLLASGRILRDWEQRVIALAAHDAEGYRRAAPPLRRFAEAHREWFVYNEVGDRWLYDGWHFQQIIAAAPGGRFADNAAWEMTTLSRRGECEGDPVCDIVRGAGPYQQFLERYPRSIFSPQAVAAMAPHLRRIASLSPEARATKELQDLVARFRGISGRLEGPAKRQAESLLTSLR